MEISIARQMWKLSIYSVKTQFYMVRKYMTLRTETWCSSEALAIHYPIHFCFSAFSLATL